MNKPRPFRFGVSVHGSTSRAEWRGIARQAEALGYSTLFLPDHLGDQLSPIPALVAAAEATSMLRVGSLVFGAQVNCLKLQKRIVFGRANFDLLRLRVLCRV